MKRQSMQRFSPWAAVMVLALAGGGMMAPAPVLARATPESFADLAENLLPSVVNISTTQKIETPKNKPQLPEIPQLPPGSPFEEMFRDFFENQQMPEGKTRKATSLGSGFVVDAAKGYIVTNNHVIADADEINVVLHNDRTIKAELIGHDPKLDIALLKIPTEGLSLKAVEFGDSDVIRVGDWVLAIGNPFGLGGTVTAGIISARARDINAGPYDDFLQTDASINRGNSGGPMFNVDGKVIGINTAIFSPSGGSVGIGFAIPANLVKPVVDQLVEYGRTRRGWLGVRIQEVTQDIAESLGLDKAQGALVAEVTDKGPAGVAGIRQGDIILQFDGKTVENMRRLPRVVAETKINKSVPVVIWRDGKRQTVMAAVGELEKAEKDGLINEDDTAKPGKPGVEEKTGNSIKALGVTLSEITPNLRAKYQIGDNRKGVVIVDVAADGPASDKDLRPGDVIAEVNQQEVKAPSDVDARLEDARKMGRNRVLMLVDRAGTLRFVALEFTAK